VASTVRGLLLQRWPLGPFYREAKQTRANQIPFLSVSCVKISCCVACGRAQAVFTSTRTRTCV